METILRSRESSKMTCCNEAEVHKSREKRSSSEMRSRKDAANNLESTEQLLKQQLISKQRNIKKHLEQDLTPGSARLG